MKRAMAARAVKVLGKGPTMMMLMVNARTSREEVDVLKMALMEGAGLLLPLLPQICVLSSARGEMVAVLWVGWRMS